MARAAMKPRKGPAWQSGDPRQRGSIHRQLKPAARNKHGLFSLPIKNVLAEDAYCINKGVWMKLWRPSAEFSYMRRQTFQDWSRSLYDLRETLPQKTAKKFTSPVQSISQSRFGKLPRSIHVYTGHRKAYQIAATTAPQVHRQSVIPALRPSLQLGTPGHRRVQEWAWEKTILAVE